LGIVLEPVIKALDVLMLSLDKDLVIGVDLDLKAGVGA
jgi:hypothetical protein